MSADGKWYVVCDRYASVDEDDPEDDPPKGLRIWTLSRDPNSTGWNTDSGCSGYGLLKADADWLAAAANEKLERDRK